MENASKALLMAGGMLISVLVLTLIVTLFVSARDISTTYNNQKSAEKIQQFNTNFTKYLGQDLTVHDVVEICNFAIENGFKQENISGFKTKDDIKADVEVYSKDESSIKKYTLTINSYSNFGYINSISFREKAN